MPVDGDVAKPNRKDIPIRSARYAISAKVLIASWWSLWFDPTSWTQRGGPDVLCNFMPEAIFGRHDLK